MVQDIGRVRNTHIKLQQTFLEIDENDIQGKDINDNDMALLDLNKDLIVHNRRLLALTNRIQKKNEDLNTIDLDQLSIDSDDLVPTQEEILLGDEDIDGIQLSDNESLLGQAAHNQETLSTPISADKLKVLLKYARKKALATNLQQIEQKRRNAKALQDLLTEEQAEIPKTPEEALALLEVQLNNEKRAFRKVYDRLDKKTGAFDRLVKFKKRLDKDLEYFVREL